MNKKKISRKTSLKIWSGVTALVLGGLIALTSVAVSYHDILSSYFGRLGEGVSASTEEIDTAYFKSDLTMEQVKERSRALVNRACDEGAVLLKNENKALPLTKNAKISVFGMANKTWSETTQGKNFAIEETLEGGLTKAGFQVNPTLSAFYDGVDKSKYYFGTGASAGGGDEEGDWTLGEVPQSLFTDAVKSSYSQYGDAAIVVLFRDDGEGGDLPRYMDRFGGRTEQTYLELTDTEKELLDSVKSAGFERTIVLYHGANPLEMGFLDREEYGIDACIWLGGTGGCGVSAIGRILSGEVNPSGRTVDTYAYDSFSSPAMQNFGDFRFAFADGSLNYSYVNYAEGIYVGYKYYETRYEDYVMKAENVGDYDYSTTVQFPFGYGLSYTSFEWSDMKVSYNDTTDCYDVSVTVTNTGDAAGKDVVEIYLQSPYTDYDKANRVEASSVKLCGFAKTGMLGAGKSETVSVSVERREFAKYDAKGAKTYILDAGDYYLTAGRNAHDAINNILSAKGYSVADGMTDEGDENLVYSDRVDLFDATVYSKSKTTGYAVTNLFDEAILSDAVYLSRSNWSVMDDNGLTYQNGSKTGVSTTTKADGEVYTHTIDETLRNKLTAKGWTAAQLSGAPAQNDSRYTPITVGKETKNPLSVIDLKGKDYDDPLWNDLLDQLKVSEMHGVFKSGGWGTVAVPSINKPRTSEQDGPAGIINTLNNTSSYYYQDEIVLAATWSEEIAEEYGDVLGNFCVVSGVAGWYSPAANTHRTPYSGRNFEYFSEDGFLAGAIGRNEVTAIQAHGVYCYLKHAMMNDQETNRFVNGACATFAGEQAIREIYETPFRMMVQDGGAHCMMTAMSRIGYTLARGHYNFLTVMVREEWGMDGVVITDYGIDDRATVTQCLAAGVNLELCPGGNEVENTKDVATRYLLRESLHRILYTEANSLAMNGFAPGSVYSTGFPVYILIVIGVWAIAFALVGVKMYFVVKELKMDDETCAAYRAKTRKFRLIYFGVLGGIVIVGITVALIVYIPVLEAAFRM